jgi:membrane protease subunit (stomatin/prohibitin family)
MENPREFYLELDPTLQLIASTRVATSAEVVGQATDVGLQQFMGMLQGMQNGKSLSEMVANSNRGAINPTLAIQEYRLAGEFDGKRLALMYQSYPEEFRRIYAGIRKIVKGV